VVNVRTFEVVSHQATSIGAQARAGALQWQGSTSPAHLQPTRT